jgi:hypothetical protein
MVIRLAQHHHFGWLNHHFRWLNYKLLRPLLFFFSEPYQASSTGTTCCAEGSWGRPGDTHGALTKLVIFDQN